MAKFRKTQSGLAICPFFTWQSENIEELGQRESDVNLVHCSRKDNSDCLEGNCNKETCPILKQ